MDATTPPVPRAGESTPGIDPDAVTGWLATQVDDLVPPLRFTLVAGGRSNLTYRVVDASGAAFALRRPPVSHVLPTAHDMAREYRIISALGPMGVPVPAAVGLCEDHTVTGASFYVMEFVDGHILRDATVSAAALDPAVRPAVGVSLADTLAALHAVDVDAAGLGDLGRREDYIGRQLRRWSGQFEVSAAAGVLRPGAVERVGAALAERIPPQRDASVVHGDYRLDNVVVRDDGTVAAILDWELCTLGEPLADLGTFVDYWTVPADGESILGRVPGNGLEGFSSGEELIARYGATSGRDVSDIGYFMAFGYWRLACILQGVYARYVGGAAAGDPTGVDELPATVARLASLAAATLEGA